MIKSNINHSHFWLVGFLFLVAYPLCISGAAFPHAYGLHQIDRSTPALTPSYRIRFMNRTSFPPGFVFGAASSAYQARLFLYMHTFKFWSGLVHFKGGLHIYMCVCICICMYMCLLLYILVILITFFCYHA